MLDQTAGADGVRAVGQWHAAKFDGNACDHVSLGQAQVAPVSGIYQPDHGVTAIDAMFIVAV